MERMTTVHKANLPLRSNESVEDFTKAAKKALKEHIGGDIEWVYIDSVFADYLVAEVATRTGDQTKTTYIRIPFSRDANGVFTFGDSVEVVPQRIFVPVAKAAEASGDVEIVKAAGESFWGGLI